MRSRNRVGFLRVFFAGVMTTFWSAVLKMLIVVAVPVAALMWFGQPALLLQYWTRGPRVNPVYDRCDYIALDGVHVITPGWRGMSADCPTIKLVPANLRKLIWG